jgi:poly-gamma-glutamate capsule biosynthesis protein CapA/YwtB (metallophosphatase superfamily)
MLADVAPLLGAADLAIGNLEGPLHDGRGAPHCTPGGIAERNRGRPGGSSCWAFRMPTRYGALLKAAGFGVLGIANNHIDDFGPAGRASTLAELDRLGIGHTGSAGAVARRVVRGRTVEVIAFAPYAGMNDMRDLQRARELVSRSTADLVVVSFHGGAEGVRAQHVPAGRETYHGEDRGEVRAFAHAVIDAGAALVVGHGPHVVRGLELYRGRLIAYSLGTFASYRGISVRGVLGLTLVLEARLGAGGRLLGGRIHPVRQRPPGGPRRDPRREVIDLMRTLSTKDFGAAAPNIAADGQLLPGP